MPEFSMQQLEALVAMERGELPPEPPRERGHDTYRYASGINTYNPPTLPRDVRRDIYNAVYSAGGAVSRADIAKALGVKKTPWLCQHIERLVDERFLVRSTEYARNGVIKYKYSIAVGV
jgi:hypothetical protein